MSDENHITEVIYEKVCGGYDTVMDFRSKLLALLPIASGAGIFMLISGKPVDSGQISYLLPIGVFGAVVGFALFCYELRGNTALPHADGCWKNPRAGAGRETAAGGSLHLDTGSYFVL